MRKCPKGVICVQNIVILIGTIVLFSIGYLLYKSSLKTSGLQQPPHQHQSQQQLQNYPQPQQININNYSEYESAYDNPTYPPLRNDGYLVSTNAIPINVQTNVSAVNVSYRQIGILTPTSQTTNGNILPLMGRPLFTGRSKFQYYTISNQHNNVKLPISVNGKSGLDERGVDEIFDGDTVYVEGYEDIFKVTKYDNGTLRYLPVI
jgi:hypothetical protein